MDTNSKPFQDAIADLTAAFVRFLEKVSPVDVPQQLVIQQVAQTLQKLSGQLGVLPVAPGAGQPAGRPEPITEGREPLSKPFAKPDGATETRTTVPPPAQFPTEPKFFREIAKTDGDTCYFDRVRPQDGDSKLFMLYTNEDEGEFAMKPVSQDNWTDVYVNRDTIFPPKAVVLEGELTNVAESECIERGRIRREGIGGRAKWIITKPCRVRIINH